MKPPKYVRRVREAAFWLVLCVTSLAALKARADCESGGFWFAPVDPRQGYEEARLVVGIDSGDPLAHVSIFGMDRLVVIEVPR